MIDVWDTTTWQDLRKTRQALRDALFDRDDELSQQDKQSIEQQLVWIQDDIDSGLHVQIPF